MYTPMIFPIYLFKKEWPGKAKIYEDLHESDILFQISQII